jgi:uracil phosphoribosyltransferase
MKAYLDIIPEKYRKNVRIVSHPLAQAILTTLRDRNTGQIEFRKGMVKLGRLIALRIVEDFETKPRKVVTPLGVEHEGIEIEGINDVVIIQVLRASMPLVEGLIKILPSARMGVISARRVEEKGMSQEKEFDIEVKYVKIPKITEKDNLIIADPMFATGSTILAVLHHLEKVDFRARRKILATVISTPIAIERVLSRYPDLLIYTVAIDPYLNEKGYIVPGLGDAGDRSFGE